jgi:S1-C subfamily serine protease
MALSLAASAVDWRPLPSTASYTSQIDLESITTQQGFGRFTVRRAYTSGQPHASGKEYFSTRAQYLADCDAGKAALGLTAYYGEDRKLIQAQIHPKARSEFAVPETGSDLAAALKQACERLASNEKSEPGGAKKAEPGSPAPGKPPVRGNSSGSGIVVSRDGLVLTNNHVVQQCNSYLVIDGKDRILKAALQASDAAKDLALLTVQDRFPAVAPVRKDAAPRLGEAVTVVGYPLVSVLGAQPSVGFGNITSTVGVRGNTAQMQISVPVQRGASGGPVLDEAGNVVGVVVAKLDALKMAQRTGDLPQNVNFAIRGDVVRSFLEANNVNFTDSGATTRLTSTEIASRGAAVTVLVRCIRQPAPATPAATTSQP